MPVVPATTSVATTATVEALPESNDATAVAEALRPPTRPTDLGAEPEPVAAADPEPRPVEEAPPSAPAETETVRGRADGTREVEATQAGPGAAATAAAQQAAATYPAEVMQRLSRTRRDRLRVSGTAVIAFTVGDNGSLVALVVAQGSGSEEVDRAGLALVQRAAPFPPPPPGAQRNFSFQFTGN
jgi:protein TonB